MIQKVQTLWPEICLFAAACVVMVLGVARTAGVRRLCAPVAAVGFVAAGLAALLIEAPHAGPLPMLAVYGKALAAVMGVLLVALLAGVADRELEARVARGGGAGFEPLRATRGEFYAFALFSVMGLMLCAGAEDLIWLFLALELTSLPTYVMVAISRRAEASLEAAVKYFFLGAMGAAVFLYGFALLYGATGTTNLSALRLALALQAVGPDGVNTLALAGCVLVFLGLSVKIAAVPMHYYTPDVYQGAAAPVSGFLAFVPKAAGFYALMLVMVCVGWNFGDRGGAELPGPVHFVMYAVAVLTMTAGNVLAIMQDSIKRILAYSSIAHSGYMLVGIIAGPGGEGAGFTRNGLAAVWFYLLVYGVMTLGAFAVVAALERRRRDGGHDEIDAVTDLRGLWRDHPLLAGVMFICAMGLLGLPPLLGFFGKLPLFTAGIASGHVLLVVILGLNSAIAAVYYLRLAFVPLLEVRSAGDDVAGPVRLTPFAARIGVGVVCAVLVVVLALAGSDRLAGAAVAAGSPARLAAPPAREEAFRAPRPRGLDPRAPAPVAPPAP
ncbi:MAG TPA: NADH-quinone oxidoreductase subunit N [Phycisphaerales bacterium]|nr:NADH-quinone oxidoreductase subunit N [Phycisphaerales bacterium]